MKEMLNSCRREVFLIDRRKKAGYGFESGTSWPVLQELGRLGVKILTGTEATAVTPEGVHIKRKDGNGDFINADTVIAVHGSQPDGSLEKILTEKGVRVRSIGNEKVTGKSIDAVRQGYEAALSIS